MKTKILEALREICEQIKELPAGGTKTYKEISIGKPDRYDDCDQIKYNPLCYYVPVGDGLYRPTMDRKIFCGEACKLIASFGDHNISEQLETLVKAGFQLYDLCLATKTSIKELSNLRYSEDTSIPPYIRKTWDWCFGINCDWHPVHQHEVREEQEKVQKVFTETTTVLHEDRMKRDAAWLAKQEKEKPAIPKKQEPEEIMPGHICLPPIKLTANSILIPYQENFDPEVYLEKNKLNPSEIPVVIKMSSKTKGKATNYLVKSSFKRMVDESFPTRTFHVPSDLMTWIARRSIPLRCFFKAFDIPPLGFDIPNFPKSWNKLNEYFGRELVAISSRTHVGRKKIQIKYNKEEFIVACKKEKQDALFQYVAVKDLLPILKTCNFSVHGFINDIGISNNALKRDRSIERILLKVNEYLGFEFFSNVGKKEAPKQVLPRRTSPPVVKKAPLTTDEIIAKIRHHFAGCEKNSITDLTSILEVAELIGTSKTKLCEILKIYNNMLYNKKVYPDDKIPPSVAQRLNDLVGKKVALSLMNCNRSNR